MDLAVALPRATRWSRIALLTFPFTLSRGKLFWLQPENARQQRGGLMGRGLDRSNLGSQNSYRRSYVNRQDVRHSTYFEAMAALIFLSAIVTHPSASFAQTASPVAQWTFNNVTGPLLHDPVSGTDDKVGGFYNYLPGASGNALRFDGYTTSVVRKAENAPKLRGSFTVEAWIALDTYPWNWVPIVDQEKDQQAGYFFGVDALGHLGLQMEIDGIWYSVTSTAQLALKKWAHVCATFDERQGMTVFIDGKEAGSLAVRGSMQPAERVDLVIGRVQQPMLPYPSSSISPHNPVWYSLDGMLDEIAIYNRSLSAQEVQGAHASAHAPAGEVIPWPTLPSGPPGAVPFGAYYSSLKFEDTWDRLRRIGPDSDVVIAFDDLPIRMVFWQGTNYIPAWVTENGKWYTDEFLETWGTACPDDGDCEPMSDKQARYSRVRILESSDARVVVHWRYALAEPVRSLGAHADPLTGWFDWADEYWTVYPDGVAIRKQVVHTSDPKNEFEWQESIVINPPGQRPEDDINFDALTVANMKGESATYTWQPGTPGKYHAPNFPEAIDKPQDPNIQWVNLKSTWKPFEIVSPTHLRYRVFKTSESYFAFPCWNHWPVTQIASSGRHCVAADRTSHTSLTNIYWDAFASTENSVTKLLMDGLTTKSAAELAPLAKSWLAPPSMDVEGNSYQSRGYDPQQRAFVIVRKDSGKPVALSLILHATNASPVVNPAVAIENWGRSNVRLEINGKPVNWGKDFRRGYVKKLEGTDLVVWMRQTSTEPTRITLTPAP